MRKIKILGACLVTVGLAFVACRKENVNPNLKGNASVSNVNQNLKEMKITDPENTDNPFDFSGKYLLNVMNLAVKSSNPYADIDNFMDTNKLTMFDVNVQITLKEYDLMISYRDTMDSIVDINEKINTAKYFEKMVATSQLFSNIEKERLLYLLSMTKYSYYFSALNDPTQYQGDYFLYILDKLNFDAIKDIDGGIDPNDPVLRPICVDMGISGQGGQCAHTWSCRSHFLWWTWGDWYEITEIVACPSGNQ